jgi:hypothetical protein
LTFDGDSEGFLDVLVDDSKGFLDVLVDDLG